MDCEALDGYLAGSNLMENENGYVISSEHVMKDPSSQVIVSQVGKPRGR